MRKTYKTPQGGPTEVAAEMQDCARRNGAHTAGPWRLITDGVKLGVAGEIVTDETTIASVNMWEQANNPGAPFANARLIAAAPDLLDALQEMVMAAGGVGLDAKARRKEALAVALVAIARATGAA